MTTRVGVQKLESQWNWLTSKTPSLVQKIWDLSYIWAYLL